MMHRTQGRQAGFVQVTLRNINSGASTNTKFRSTDSVEFCHTENQKLEYSYEDESGYHFMDPVTFEDNILPRDVIEPIKKFLIETNSYEVLFVDGKAVELQLPAAVEMKVVDAPDAIRGDTAGNVQKPITTQTGLVVQVPLFIKKDEIIRVSTDNGSYLSRA
jgi:elongation factor P